MDARDRRDEPWRDGVQFGAMAEITTAMGGEAGAVYRGGNGGARDAIVVCFLMPWMADDLEHDTYCVKS